MTVVAVVAGWAAVSVVVAVALGATLRRAGGTERRPVRAAGAIAPTRHVLVVDDAADARTLLTIALRAGGFTVVGEAAVAEDAIELAARLQPDAVVLDLRMPGMGGLTALPVIRRVAPDATVVVSSIDPADQRSHEVATLGAAAYVEKADGRFGTHVTDALLELCA